MSADELAKVLANVRAQAVYARDELDDRAEKLGRLDAHGLPINWEDELPNKLQAITPKMIRDVAKRYLQPERLATLYLHTPSSSASITEAGVSPR